jgi:ABC-type Fe3+-hydroxamate transport system substrate-binding protein
MPTPQRIVSLVPSLTETLFELGLDREIIGVTRFCSEPAARMIGRTRVGGTKNPDQEKIAACEPDLVLCNTEENRPEDLDWLQQRFEVMEFFPRTVQDAGDMVLAIGRAVDRTEEAEAIRLLIEAERARVEAELFAETRLRVFYPIWKDPWMTIGPDTFVNDMLATCGAVNVFEGSEHRYPEIQLQQIPALKPDLCLLPSEPYAFTEQHRVRLLNDPVFCGRTIQLVDGKWFSWHGARTYRGLRAAHGVIQEARQTTRRGS